MPGENPSLVNALSFDIEDWFHIVDASAALDVDQWPRLSSESSLVVRYTDRILSICDHGRVKATFFILGWIAEQHPTLVKRIADAGHEVGTHSFWHRKVYALTPEEFSADIAKSLEAIRAAIGYAVPITGFRAPSFSIIPGTEWAFDVLAELGIEYDASLFPGTRAHGGYATQLGPQLLRSPKGRTVAELPMSIAPVGVGPVRKTMCFSGGGYLRVLPQFMIDQGMRSETSAGRASVVYLHPRDFAPDCPRIAMPPHRYFKCYVGLRSTEDKLRHLLETYRWGTCRDVLQQAAMLTAQRTN